MEIVFPAIEAHNATIHKQTDSNAVAQKKSDIFSSFQIQQLLLGFTAQEVQVVKNVRSSYLLMLEAIALVRRNRTRKEVVISTLG